MQRRLVVFAIFVIWITLKMSYNDAVVFKFSNAVCESYNESWAVVNKCRLRAINRNMTVLNINMTLLHPVTNMLVEFQVFKKANGYKPWLIKTTWDPCRFFKKHYNPFAIIVFRLLKEFSNFNHSCPYVGDQVVDGFYLRPELLGLVLPTGDYLLALTWLFDNKKQFIINLYATYTEDLI